jgi:hypothetical protein
MVASATLWTLESTMNGSAAGAVMTKRNDVSVKVDSEAVRIARNVATFRGKSLAEYLSEVILDVAASDWKAILEEEQRSLPQGPRKKPPAGPK